MIRERIPFRFITKRTLGSRNRIESSSTAVRFVVSPLAASALAVRSGRLDRAVRINRSQCNRSDQSSRIESSQSTDVINEQLGNGQLTPRNPSGDVELISNSTQIMYKKGNTMFLTGGGIHRSSRFPFEMARRFHSGSYRCPMVMWSLDTFHPNRQFVWYQNLIIMLRNYAYHAQFPKSSVHSVHKCRAKQSDRPLKSCHIDHLLWNHVSSLTFMRAMLADRLFTGEWSIQSTWLASISYVPRGRLSAGLSGLISDLWGRYVHEIVHDHAHVQRDQVNFWACTCAHMHKTDLPIAPNKRHARYFMDIISSTSMRGDSSVELFRLLHKTSNSSAHCTKKSKSCA
jgi:hypothetical protein